MWLPPEEVAVATEGGPDLGVEPVWRDDIELLDADIDLGDRPRDPTDPDITIPIRHLDRPATPTRHPTRGNRGRIPTPIASSRGSRQ
jgi:hypothetical protein